MAGETFDATPDLLYDFVFATLTQDLNSSDTTVTVDDVSEFPLTDDLANGKFWMTIESPLTHPHSFEIVQVTAIDTVTKTLTLVRGERSGTASHDSGAYIKSTVSAELLRKISYGYGGTSLPAADTTIFNDGDRFYHYTEHRWYYLNGGASAWQVLGGSSGGLNLISDQTTLSWQTADIIIYSGTSSTFPLSAGSYYMDFGPKALSTPPANEFVYTVYYSVNAQETQILLPGGGLYTAEIVLHFSGLNPGDEVAVLWRDNPNGQTWTRDYALSDGTVYLTHLAPAWVAVSNDAISFPVNVTIDSASTSVVIDWVNVTLSVAAGYGAPQWAHSDFAPADNNSDFAGAISDGDTVNWNPDDYDSIDVISGTYEGTLSGTEIYNPRWFTFTPASDGTMSAWAENGGNEEVVIAVWHEAVPYWGTATFSPLIAAGPQTPYPSADFTGSAWVESLAVTGGDQYWIAVGTHRLNPVAGTQTTLNFSLT